MALFDFASWLRQAFTRSHREAKQVARRKKAQALTLEQLEDRVTPAVPTISSLSQTFATEGDPSFILTVNGSNYASNATVDWNGVALATSLVNSGQLTATVPTADLVEEGSASITVVNPSQSETSAAQTFVINDAPLTATAVPVSAAEGAAITNAEVATFTDADPNAVAADYNVTVNWGDGQTSPGTVTPANGGGFAVTASKPDPYAEYGPYTVSVTIFDTDDGSTTNESWTAAAALPVVKNALQVVEGTNGLLYALGGYDNSGIATGTAYAYDPAASNPSWTQVASMFTARTDLGAAVGTNGLIYVMGGQNSSGNLSSVEAYNPSTNQWTQLASLPVALVDLAATTGSDGTIYAIGGYENGVGYSSAVYAYTPSTNTWAQVASLPTGVANLAAVTGTDGTIYAIGGITNNGDSSAVYTYTPGATSWATGPSLPTARAYLAATVGLDGTIYAIGGDDATLGSQTNTVYALAPDAPSWTLSSAALSTGRDSLGAATGADGRLYALGGNAPNIGYTNIVETLGVPRSIAGTTESITVSDPAVIATAGQSVVNAPAGGSTNLVLLATFTDPGGAEGLSHYSATVNWGDGTALDPDTQNSTDANPNVFIVQEGNLFLVEGAHVYATAGDDTITTTIHHDAAPDASVTESVVVSPAPPDFLSATGGYTITATEGSLSPSQTVATFTDPLPELTGDSPTAGDYTATISWGDGTAPDTNGVITYSNGVFTVSGAHDYAEEGTYTVSVLLQRNGAPNVTVTSTAEAADAALTENSFTPPTATEGALFSGPVFNFRDADPNGTASDYTATVQTGDGHTYTSAANPGLVQVVSDGHGGFNVNLIYTYAEALSGQTFRVSVQDSGGAPAIGDSSSTFSVADAALTPGMVSATGGVVGVTPTSLSATFTDANGNAPTTDFSGTINWGDGNSTAFGPGAIVANGGGSFTVSATHQYAEASALFVIDVTINDVGGKSTTDNGTTTVADAPLTVTQLLAPTNAVEGVGTGTLTVAAFTDDNPAGTAANYTATITWGDGATSTATQMNGGIVADGNGFDVLGSHTYAEEGATANPFSVTVTDVFGGASDTRTGNPVMVADAPLTAGTVSATGGVGGATATSLIATFNDANTAAPTSDFSGTINWGDGQTMPFTSTNVTGGNGRYTVSGTHQYAAEGTYAVTLTIHDAGGSSASDSGSTTVADAAFAVTLKQPTGVVENTPVTAAVATFTDANVNATPADFTATITWGDGTTSTVSAANGGITESGSVFSVQGSHAYLQAGTTAAAFAVAVTDASGATVTQTGTPIAVGLTPTYAVADFQGQGVYRYVDTGVPATSGWTSLHSADASQVAVDANGDVVAVFDSTHVSAANVGVWLYPSTGAAEHLSGGVPTSVAIVSPGYIVATFPTDMGAAGEGVWRFEAATGWDHLNVKDGSSTAASVPAAIEGLNASLIGIDGFGNVVGEFSGQGVWRFMSVNNTWQLLTRADASGLQLAANGILAAEFPGQGVWEMTLASGWRQIETQDVSALSVNVNNVLAAVFQTPLLPSVYRFPAPTAPATNPPDLQDLNASDATAKTVQIAASNGVFTTFADTDGLYYYSDATDQWTEIFPASATANTDVLAFAAD